MLDGQNSNPAPHRHHRGLQPQSSGWGKRSDILVNSTRTEALWTELAQAGDSNQLDSQDLPFWEASKVTALISGAAIIYYFNTAATLPLPMETDALTFQAEDTLADMGLPCNRTAVWSQNAETCVSIRSCPGRAPASWTTAFIWGHKGSMLSFPCLWSNATNWMCLPKIHLWKPNLQGDGIWRRGLCGERLRSGEWSPHEWMILMPLRENSCLFPHRRTK